MEKKDSNLAIESNAFGAFLLDVGISLIEAGASTSRIKLAMSRLADAYDYVPHITIGSKMVFLVLNEKDGDMVYNGARSSSVHGIDFNLISTIDKLSWMVAEKRLSLQELREELNKYRALGHYPRIIILCFVSLAGAAFCYTFGGSYIEMIITFGATFCGLFIKQQLSKSNVNPYICTYVAATIASLFTGVFHITGLTISPVNAFSTCVLFLIPGVPLINSFNDLIDGNTTNGIVKGVNALIHVFAIALGLLTTIIVLNLKG